MVEKEAGLVLKFMEKILYQVDIREKAISAPLNLKSTTSSIVVEPLGADSLQQIIFCHLIYIIYKQTLMGQKTSFLQTSQDSAKRWIIIKLIGLLIMVLEFIQISYLTK